MIFLIFLKYDNIFLKNSLHDFFINLNVQYVFNNL